MKPRSAAALVALSLAFAPGCHKDEPATAGDRAGATSTATPQSQAELDAPIATIDDLVITVREFQERLDRQSPYLRARYSSLEQKKDFLESLVRYELLAREAYRRGLEKDPDAVRAMKTVMIQKLMKAEFDAAVKPEDIAEADIKAYYDAHPEEWNKPEEVRVSAIVLRDAASADAAAKAATGPEGRGTKGFRDLVTKLSTDEESKRAGGDLRYFARGDARVPAPVVEAALAMTKTGQVSGPIDAGDGTFYVIRQTGRRPAVTKTYDQVKRQIQNSMWKDRRATAQETFVAGLEKNAKIEINEANLAKVRIAPAGPDDAHQHGQGPGFEAGLMPPTTPTTPTDGKPPAPAAGDPDD
jgi:peptidyl-prolyl cis-trans isomerase C